MIERITIVGTGKVAFHFMKIFSEKKKEISIIGRNKNELQNFKLLFNCEIIESYALIKKNGLVIVCTPDDSLISILSQIDQEISVVYTSGILDLKEIINLSKKTSLGVFYPLQSFSKQRQIDFSEVPILIEASNDKFGIELFELAKIISENVKFVNSTQRKQIHLAAVFANNFTNHILHLAKIQIEDNGNDWKLLFPLIEETFKKAIEIGPLNAQTGPAKRNDQNTIEKHLEIINSKYKSLYKDLTNSILELNKNEKL